MEQALQQPDSGTRAFALELLAEFTDGDAIVPLLRSGLHDSDPEARLAALRGAVGLPPQALIPFIGEVFANSDASVRQSGLELAAELHPADYLNLLATGAASAYADLATQSLDEASLVVDKSSVSRFFPALDSADPEVKESAREFFDFRFETTFGNSAEADAWWQKNADRYNEDLAEVVPIPDAINLPSGGK
ncbi:MAG: HEAT repeat domain-containing protein [Verrucomicrobiae bacterium]|nr:HEAT repeat domain-containing protein [Verrucomicrobiae bacterium]